MGIAHRPCQGSSGLVPIDSRWRGIWLPRTGWFYGSCVCVWTDPSAMVEENEDDEEASTSSTGPEATGGGAIGPASPSSFSSSIYTPRETVVTVVRRKKGQAAEGSGAGVTVIHPPHHVQDLIPHGRERLQQGKT